MKHYAKFPPMIATLVVLGLVGGGCVVPPNRLASHNYLQRHLRVAIIPGINKTDQPKANIVFDKAWEDCLNKLGYQVVSADQVITYSGANGVSLADVRKMPVKKLCQELKVDAILETQILRWKNSYKVIEADDTVSGRATLVEGSTGATIWDHQWVFQSTSNSGGNNGLVGMLVDAVVTAAINAATDESTRLANQGVAFSSGTMPHPGTAPSGL